VGGGWLERVLEAVATGLGAGSGSLTAGAGEASGVAGCASGAEAETAGGLLSARLSLSC
jgi:hypothetical protein